jgi:hypothetical protein
MVRHVRAAQITAPNFLPKPRLVRSNAVDARGLLRPLSPTGKTNPNLFRVSRSAGSMKGFLIVLQCARIQADTSDVLVTKL